MKQLLILFLALGLVLAACAPAAPAAPVEVTRIVNQVVTATPVTPTAMPVSSATLAVSSVTPTLPVDTCSDRLVAEQALILKQVKTDREGGKFPSWEPKVQLTKLDTKGEQFQCLYSVTFRDKVTKYDDLNAESYKTTDLVSFMSVVTSVYGKKQAFISLYVINADKSITEIQVENYVEGKIVAGILLYVNLKSQP